ncbi:MAG: hypothetical protein M1818_003426 [Claussenomyces sp. TS43310]|nr:MAG: hypothetical protein M1818_003426 [Claussenomyces sp. TS43310]
MGSMEGTQVVGQFTHPLIAEDTKNDDPWQRNYYQPPQLKKLVPRTFPLTDIRPTISDPKYVPADLFASHGFGVVKHRSALLEQPCVQEDLTEQAIIEEYHPEIRDLVVKTTGAKHVFIIATVLRRGPQAPEPYKLPGGLGTAAADSSQREQKEIKVVKNLRGEKLVVRAAPVRVPHMDFTPLGARQTIRSQERDIYNVAIDSGVIAAEDKICENHPFLAQSKEAGPVIAELYNQNGRLGPRYAAYSVWRPLKKVGRDPLALAPSKNMTSTDGDFVYWPYENRIPGPPELGGDYLKEYAMLGVRGESPVSDSNSSHSLQWYYLSAQERDEVLFIKLFDSAALGEDAQEAGAPWHGSADIGAVEDDHPRESIELRVLAFW